MRIRRTLAGLSAAVLLVGTGLLAAAPGASAYVDGFTDNHDGTFTLTYGAVEGMGVWFCPGTMLATDCDNEHMAQALYVITLTTPAPLPPSPVLIEPGMSVTAFDGFASAPLPSGWYSISYFENFNPDVTVHGLQNVCIGTCPATEKPIPPWVQSYGRGSAGESCKEGWNASWEKWPNGNTGGYVCTRIIPSLG